MDHITWIYLILFVQGINLIMQAVKIGELQKKVKTYRRAA